VAEREILSAATGMLRERPFRELTVDEVMRRTDLSRPSFYVYFRDRHELVLRVVEHIGAELWAISEGWYTGSGDGPALARRSLDRVVDVFVEHGPLLCALADAAADDPQVDAVYTSLVEAFVGVTTRHIEREIAAGRTLPLDAGETATALVWMMERYLVRSLGRSGAARRDTVAETLGTIWVRVLYGGDARELSPAPAGATR
jgi:TetR/AcrR family transcriptional regulator, ethionamide resistance regulator